IPIDSPTITRISVISTAIATIEISDRNGRCTRFASTILFMLLIFSLPLVACRCPSVVRRRAWILLLVQVHQRAAGWLRQHELVVAQLRVRLHAHDRQRDGIFFLRPADR